MTSIQRLNLFKPSKWKQKPNDRLHNLIIFIEAHKEKIKSEKIEKLKAELAELETKAEV